MNNPSPRRSNGDSSTSGTAGDRRGFLGKVIAATLGAVPAVTGIVAFLNPLRQRGQAGQFKRLASLEALPEDGTPRKFPVIADRTDAWNRFPSEPIGAVFLRRLGGGRVGAIQVVCPHAGCSVQFEPSAEGGKFFCPCHSASFDLSGKRLDATSPSPRDLDPLEVEIRNNSEIWVMFQNFRTGTAKRIAEA